MSLSVSKLSAGGSERARGGYSASLSCRGEGRNIISGSPWGSEGVNSTSLGCRGRGDIVHDISKYLVAPRAVKELEGDILQS